MEAYIPSSSLSVFRQYYLNINKHHHTQPGMMMLVIPTAFINSPKKHRPFAHSPIHSRPQPIRRQISAHTRVQQHRTKNNIRES